LSLICGGERIIIIIPIKCPFHSLETYEGTVMVVALYAYPYMCHLKHSLARFRKVFTKER
jgi:hypothetical protein